MNRQRAIRVFREEMKKLEDAARSLAQLYDYCGDELNDREPVSFAKVIPMSLDEWSSELAAAREDWIRELRSPMIGTLRMSLDSLGAEKSAAKDFADEVENQFDKKWTATDVQNWFVLRRSAFVPDDEESKHLSALIN
jgi:hypothetical protein